MNGIDETTVLKHGKALAAQDGFIWEINFNSPREGGVSFRGLRFLSEDRRQDYLARARAELLKETGDA